jgi:hypothetical protein
MLIQIQKIRTNVLGWFRRLDTLVRQRESFGGMSLYFCIGWYAGWKIRYDGPSLIATLGFVSIGIMWRDLERMIDLQNRLLSKWNEE